MNDKDIEKYLINIDEAVSIENRNKLIKDIQKHKNKIKDNEIDKKVKVKELYPSYYDSNFHEKLFKKKEYFLNKSNKYSSELENETISSFFKLTNNQNFVKKLISPTTPYKTLYLYQGVGVGKTCASIQIVHNFKKYYNKKALVILPTGLTNNYEKSLFNIKKFKERDEEMFQCLGNYYLDKRIPNDMIEKKARALIKNDYEFMGLGVFANKIKKIRDNSLNEKDYKNKIQQEFDNRVIIIDEFHNLRRVDKSDKNYKKDKKEKKEGSLLLLKMLSLVQDTRLVLLTATPMFDDANEIKFLLKTIMIHEKIEHIKDRMQIFEPNSNKITKNFEEILKNLSSRYISYMRGENPYTFPVRLYPSINNNKHILNPENYPTKDNKGEKIKKIEQLKYIELLYTDMSSLQKDIYNDSSKLLIKDINEDDDEKITNFQILLQISNIIYPSKKLLSKTGKIKKDNFSKIKDLYGDIGFRNVFNNISENSKRKKVEYKKENEEILSQKNIGKYSPKIKLILDHIKKADGICLIYSRYLTSGLYPIAIALEHMGINKYDGYNILSGAKEISPSPFKGSYIIIDSKNTNIDKEISKAIDNENKDGDIIKVILISDKGSEGIDLKNIREVHILEPWFNLNKIEQIIGRGVRYKSHENLLSSLQNTTIYHYVNIISSSNMETIDFRVYRKAELKQKKISAIERIIKKNAIDCNLNEDILLYKNVKKTLITSQKKRIKNYDISDKPCSRICDYMDCDFKCENKISFNIDDKDLDKTTYNKEVLEYDIELMKKEIMNYFRYRLISSLKKMEKKLVKPSEKIVLYHSLDEMTRKIPPIIFKGYNDRLGYLKYRGDKYIFHPADISDLKLTLMERKQSKLDKYSCLDISKLPPKKYDEAFLDIENFNENNNVKVVKNKKRDINNKIEINYKNLIQELKFNESQKKKYNDIIWDMLIDGLNLNNLNELYEAIYLGNLNKDNENNIIKSLERSDIIIRDDNNNIIGLYNYYLNNFLCHEVRKGKNKIFECSVLLKERFFDILTENMIKRGIDKVRILDINLYGYINPKKNMAIRIIKDLDKIKSGKYIGKGSECEQTSTFSIKKMRDEYLNKFYDDIKIPKEKYKKNELCLIYEYTLRRLDKKNNGIKNYLRPAEYIYVSNTIKN
jgi:hypothetical protein